MMRTRIFCFLLLIFGVFLGLFIDYGIVALRDLSCNQECKAQLLYKNKFFFQIRGELSKIIVAQKNAESFDASRYSADYLAANGVSLMTVMTGGRLMVLSRVGHLGMLAEPILSEGKVNWKCSFFDGTTTPPASRSCSYQ